MRSSDAGYHRLANQLPKFASAVLLDFDMDSLCKIDQIEETLRNNKAVYHKKCYDQYNVHHLDRLLGTKKRKIEECNSNIDKPAVNSKKPT